MSWKEFIKGKRNRVELVVTLILLAIILTSFTSFLNFVQSRNGVVLPDPILSLFNPVDLTWFIFAFIYISLIIAVVSLVKDPKLLVFSLQVYTLMIIVRIVAMYLLPLNPPANMIILKDPFVEFFSTGQPLTKDLFFSGHTATLFILFLVSEKKILKTLFLISTIVIAISVLLQHVHYTIDVFGAFFFTYTCYKLLLNFRSKYYYG